MFQCLNVWTFERDVNPYRVRVYDMCKYSDLCIRHKSLPCKGLRRRKNYFQNSHKSFGTNDLRRQNSIDADTVSATMILSGGYESMTSKAHWAIPKGRRLFRGLCRSLTIRVRTAKSWQAVRRPQAIQCGQASKPERAEGQKGISDVKHIELCWTKTPTSSEM